MPSTAPPSAPERSHPDDDREPHAGGILTATHGVHAPPELRPGSGPRQRRFVALILAAALVVAVAVGAVNALVDPYGAFGTGLVGPAVWTDRTEKVGLIERLPTPPRLVVLGSSRAMKVEPHYLTRLTGLPAFNAAVSSGRPVDAYVFAQFLHQRFPGVGQSYLWLLDQEAFADDTIDPTLLADDKLAGYVPAEVRWRSRADDLSRLFSWRTLDLSWRTWHEGRQATPAAEGLPQDGPGRGVQGGRQPSFAPDGYRVNDANTRAAAGGRSLARGLADSRAVFVRRYQRGFPGLAESPRDFFERSVEAMNGWGATPVVVLSPVQPRLLRELRPYGWDERHQEVLAYLRAQQTRHDFVLLDMSRVRSFGGSPRAFYDGVHMTPSNYRKLVRAVLADPAAMAALDQPGAGDQTAGQ